MTDRDSRGRFAAENQVALKHGNARSLKSLQFGRPLKGVARELADETAKRLYNGGPRSLLEDRAAEHRGVALLFLKLVLEEEDAANLNRWIARFHWLNHRSFLMARDLVRLGVGDRAAILDEMRNMTIDQVTVAALAHGLTVGASDHGDLDLWARQFGASSTKAGLMLRTLSELEQVDDGGNAVLDYEQLLEEQNRG